MPNEAPKAIVAAIVTAGSTIAAAPVVAAIHDASCVEAAKPEGCSPDTIEYSHENPIHPERGIVEPTVTQVTSSSPPIGQQVLAAPQAHPAMAGYGQTYGGSPRVLLDQ